MVSRLTVGVLTVDVLTVGVLLSVSIAGPVAPRRRHGPWRMGHGPCRQRNRKQKRRCFRENGPAGQNALASGSIARVPSARAVLEAWGWGWRGVGVARGAPRPAARAAARVGPSP